VPQYVALETVKYILLVEINANVDRCLAWGCASSVDVSQNDDNNRLDSKFNYINVDRVKKAVYDFFQDF